MLWFGIGDRPAIFLIFLASFFPIVVPTIIAVRQVNSTYLRVAANFGLSPAERVVQVIVPAILPVVLPALRISLGVAWLVVVAAEMIAVKSGLGYLILDARNALRMDHVITAMIAIGAIGVVLDHVIARFSRMKSMGWGLV
jgi:NitT/TauT family transport system permease protein